MTRKPKIKIRIPVPKPTKPHTTKKGELGYQRKRDKVHDWVNDPIAICSKYKGIVRLSVLKQPHDTRWNDTTMLRCGGET